MSRIPMTQLEIEEMKKQILDSAFRIVYSEGYSGLSMRKLASMLKMTAANIYNYFSNKDELNIEMRRYGFVLLYDLLKKTVDKETEITGRIKSVIKEFISFGLNNPHYYALLFNMPTPKYSDYIGTPMEKLARNELESSLKVLELMKTIVAEFLEKGGKIVANPITSILLILSYLHGIITLNNNRMFIYLHENPETVVDNLVNIILQIIPILKDNDTEMLKKLINP